MLISHFPTAGRSRPGFHVLMEPGAPAMAQSPLDGCYDPNLVFAAEGSPGSMSTWNTATSVEERRFQYSNK